MPRPRAPRETVVPSPPAAPPGTVRLAAGGLSVLVSRGPLLAGVALTAVLVAVVAVCLSVGDVAVAPLDALRAAVLGTGSPRDLLVVTELRMPRVEAGVAVGAALGAAGCLMQTLSGNRLATPDTVGLNNGATAFAVAGVVAGPTSVLPPATALTGAATAAALTLALSGGVGQRGYRFLVVGLGVGAVFGAATNLILSRAEIDAANAAFAWTVGTLNGRSQPAVTVLEVGLLVCLPLAVVLARGLNALRFSDAVATVLGERVRPLRVAVLLTSVVCAGLAVAVAGPVGMIALAAPEAARRLTGPGPVPVLTSALAGAVLTLSADLVGRTVMAPLEIPVGLVTAVVGGPYLLWLLLTTRTRRTP
ncbi:iron chelate uptake ABC transporter family permease subunit [Streptomyces sp. TRM43335]|uniref:Iron chelate uptake ABC transporter family permease subunit n=1 Tax=Streptomyces taklimakanensis TaxID=2569853 RepID=A0A6G2BHV3_9ACTN|nr:iron chelate uptake ABC transporter family permease subunit [Streptomyces taklimakanensis]